MAETDETVGAMFWCIKTALAQVGWHHVPAIDGVEDVSGDPEAKKRADFMNQVIVDMAGSFNDHVEDALTMMWAGFAAIEMVTKRRDGTNSRFKDGYYGFKSLNLISQITIWNWQYDQDQLLQSFTQSGGNAPIPAYKTLLYRTTSAYNSPKGRPLLKNAWRSWKLKRKVQDTEAIGIERDLVGLPVMRMPKEVMDQQFETDKDGNLTADAMAARRMVQSAQAATQDLRLNKSGGLVIPSDTWGAEESTTDTTPMYDFEIVTTGGQRTIDARTVVRDYDAAIARVVLLQFLMLGQRSGGSYGLSDDQSSMALSSIVALADRIADVWNKTALPYLEIVNAMDPKYRPRLRHDDINKNTISQLGQFIAGIGKGTDLWAGDSKTRIGLLKAANLPYDVDAQNEAADTYTQGQNKLAAPDPEPQPVPVPVPAEDSQK